MLSFVLFLAAMISISFGADSFIEADAKTKAVRVPIYRYWNALVSDHFYTQSASEIGTTTPGQVGNHLYTSEGTGFYLLATGNKKTVPLYRYWLGSVSDHFYTTNAGEIGTTIPGATGNHGYVSEGVLGYCLEKQSKKGKTIVPLYRYWLASVSDHFYTTNCAEIGCNLAVHQSGAHGYVYEGIQCYVYSSDSRTIDEELKENGEADFYQYDEIDTDDDVALFFGLSPQLFLTEENGINWTVIAGIMAFIFAIFGMIYYYGKKRKDEYKPLTFDDEV